MPRGVDVRMCMRACILAYPSCKVHAPYCIVISGLAGSTPPFNILINGTLYGKKLQNIKCVFRFSLQILCKIFLILKKTKRHCNKCEDVIVKSIRYSCRILIKFAFSRQIFEKTRKYQISPKSVHWKPICSIRTNRCIDRHDEAKSSFLQFFGRA
jgi:hypothetical protein